MKRLLALTPFVLLACGSSDPSDAGARTDGVTDAAPADVAADAASADVTDAASDAPHALTYTWASQTAPTDGPLGRWGYEVASVGDGTAYIFGGTDLTVSGRGTVSNDLWRFDARTDPPTFTRVTTTGAPPNRYCGCVGYVPTTRTLVMIGGRNPNEAPAETWALSLDTMAWTRLAVPTTPGGVIGCQLAWSAARSAMYLFGGGSESTGFSGATSRLDADAPAWVTLAPTGTVPRGRYDDAFFPLPDGRRMVMVAGARGSAAGAPFLNDTWLFDAMTETWSQVATEGELPHGRRTPWISVDPDGNGFLMAMGAIGLQASEVLSDTWHMDLTTGHWTNLTLDPLPPARGFVAALPGHGATRGYLTSGFDNSAPLRDLWRLRAE